MRVKSLRMKDYRSYVDSGVIELDTINVLIGANNSGKSSILRGLHQLQSGQIGNQGDVRVGRGSANIEIKISTITGKHGWVANVNGQGCTYIADIYSDDRRSGSWSARVYNASQQQIASGDIRLPNIEPDHHIVPYLSKRKTVSYVEDVREQYLKQVTSDVSNLAAKLARLGNSSFPKHEAYKKACKEVLGFVVTAIPSPNGQQPGIYLPNSETIPIEQMGEGIPNIALMLANLSISTDKLFLIEEPENDLHPTALKALLDLIIESSSSNQFVISTHSNIVVRNLCSTPNSKLFRVSAVADELPTRSHIEPVPQTSEARIAVLQELGYSFSDFDMWDGWLILEESSAEQIINGYLIPWYVPELKRLRTVSASGVNRVEPLLDDFLRLMVFTHLQPAYRDRTWVRVDNDTPGNEVLGKLKRKYKDWEADRFNSFKHDNFEQFYPHFFSSEVERVLDITDNQSRLEAKKTLLLNVLKWLDEDPIRGKKALELSAAPVIADLRRIASQLLS